MDFRTLAIAAEATSRQATDALLLVIVGDRLPASLDAPLQQAVKDAVALGDFAYKPAQVAYLRQVAGVKAARVTVVAAKDGSAKAVRAAALAGIGQIKSEKRAGLRVHNRTGEPCDVCGTLIAQVRLADSSFQYCPGCQTGGKPLADRRMSRLLK